MGLGLGAWGLRLEAGVSVGNNHVAGVSLQLREPATVAGRIVFEGATPRPTTRSTVSFVAADGRPLCCQSTQVSPDGSFRIAGFLPGKYFPSWSNLPGWQVKSVTAGGRDILRSPLAIENESVRT